MGANAIQLYRPLTAYEQACRIDFAELNARLDRQLTGSLGILIKDVNDIEQNVVNQVRRWKVLTPRGYSRINKVTVSVTPFRKHLLNSLVYHYFEGREDAKREISNSLGKRLRLRYVVETDLLPKEAMGRFQKRAAVTKAEFSRMAAKERARAFTVAGVLEQDMLATTRQGLIKAIDEGWTLNEFSRYLKEANVKYTGTVYGTDKKKGEPLTPYHLENVLRTNYATVYNEGRLDMMNHPDVVEFVPAFQYSAILDSRVRKSHADMDGRIYLRDDPIWMTWYPPNGYQCRCMVVPVTSNKEFSISTPAPKTLMPDEGFGVKEVIVARKKAIVSKDISQYKLEPIIETKDNLIKQEHGLSEFLDVDNARELAEETKSRLVKTLADRLEGNDEFMSYVITSHPNDFVVSSRYLKNVKCDMYKDSYAKIRDTIHTLPQWQQEFINNILSTTREKTVSEWIHQWAISSGDKNAISLCLQKAIEEEFGIHGVSSHLVEQSKSVFVKKEVERAWKVHEKGMRAFVREQYNYTQEMLEGRSHVILYRGIRVSPKMRESLEFDKIVGKVVDLDISLQPASSFSGQVKTAIQFAGKSIPGADDSAMLIQCNVPKERILSTCQSGFGCKKESEFTILGGKDTVRAFTLKDQSEMINIAPYEKFAK